MLYKSLSSSAEVYQMPQSAVIVQHVLKFRSLHMACGRRSKGRVLQGKRCLPAVVVHHRRLLIESGPSL